MEIEQFYWVISWEYKHTLTFKLENIRSLSVNKITHQWYIRWFWKGLWCLEDCRSSLPPNSQQIPPPVHGLMILLITMPLSVWDMWSPLSAIGGLGMVSWVGLPPLRAGVAWPITVTLAVWVLVCGIVSRWQIGSSPSSINIVGMGSTINGTCEGIQLINYVICDIPALA